jgi:RNA exonuclease 4
MLGIQIQSGEHSSVVDAQAAMAIYLKVRGEWEKSIRDKKLSGRVAADKKPGDAGAAAAAAAPKSREQVTKRS